MMMGSLLVKQAYRTTSGNSLAQMGAQILSERYLGSQEPQDMYPATLNSDAELCRHWSRLSLRAAG